MKLILIISKLTLLFLFCAQSFAQKEEKVSSNPSVDSEKSLPDKTRLEFSVNQVELESKTTANTKNWLTVREQQHLLLVRTARNKKHRGNVIIFHARGEHADHPRVIHPLSVQLTNLGWTVHAPNFALDDFPQLEKERQPESQSTSQPVIDEIAQAQKSSPTEIRSSARTNFKTEEEYQNYFNSLCIETINSIASANKKIVIIANEQAAYWSISCLQQSESKYPIVFLDPRYPKDDIQLLDSDINALSNPLLSFVADSRTENRFIEQLENASWSIASQRINKSSLFLSHLPIEDIYLAKSITGWADKL
ncbi:MAG: alpha/beta hydrolase family protein [Kangiellaceae bacterium]|nr:alpha/beta hydrolase family protein [Kangiellaceae bacterium]